MKRLLSLFLIATAAFAQPSVYNASSPQTLNSGDVATVWNAETPTPGNGTTAASQQVTFSIKNGRAGSPFSVDGQFSAAPGVFEVDVQCASTDSDTQYQTISNGAISTVDPTNQTFRLDTTQSVCRFGRLLMRSRTNSVSITAKITAG